MNVEAYKSGSPKAELSDLELRIPPLPATLVEAVRLLDEPDSVDVASVAEMVERDAAIVARLLHVVNSAYYSLPRSVTSAERAVVLLGPVAVTSIVMGMDLMRLRSIVDSPAADCFMRLSRHSMATAFIARHIVEGDPREARRVSVERIGDAFTGGMLHDFGKILLVYNFPVRAALLYDELLAKEANTERRETDLEREVFGFTHTEAGLFGARRLGYPFMIRYVIEYHHSPHLSSGEGHIDTLLRAVAAANLAAKALGYASGRSVTVEECKSHQVWEMITEKDRRGTSPTALSEEVLALQSHVDDYVGTLSDLSKR